MSRNIHIISYGPARWGYKFETGVVQKIYPTKEDAIFYGRQIANQFDSEVWVEEKNGKLKKLKA